MLVRKWSPPNLHQRGTANGRPFPAAPRASSEIADNSGTVNSSLGVSAARLWPRSARGSARGASTHRSLPPNVLPQVRAVFNDLSLPPQGLRGSELST